MISSDGIVYEKNISDRIIGLIDRVCTHIAALGGQVHGLDNNQTGYFFRARMATPRWNQNRLTEKLGRSFQHHEN